MSVLKDFICKYCGNSTEISVSPEVEDGGIWCDVCEKNTYHYSACNGGTKTTPKGIGIYSRDYGDDIRFAGMGSEKSDGSPLIGGLLDKLNDKDRMNENRSKLKFKKDQQRGGGKLIFS